MRSRDTRTMLLGSSVFGSWSQLRGRAPELILPCKLVDNDDWNQKPAQYDFVRPTGRSGSCYTNQYRAGAEYPPFLKKKQDGTLTTRNLSS
jgi:hypothetical protein